MAAGGAEHMTAVALPDPAAVPAIEFRDVTKSYGPVRALDGVDLQVRRGEIFGFLGPNGAGKTTAIRILVDLLRPDRGTVSVLGLDAQAEGVEVRRRIGYLAADRQLYEQLTAQQLFDYVDAIRAGAVDRDYLQSLVDQLDLECDRRIGTLSSGNRQKVGLIQALMARPEVVILDEPTSGLDPLMQEVLEKILREVATDGRTVFFSSHVLAEVERLCDRAAILRAGRIVDVFNLAEQRRLAPRRVEVTFDVAPPPDAFTAITGVDVKATRGATVVLDVRDGFDELVKHLARYTVEHLESQQPTLEEMFLSHYEHPGSDSEEEGER